MANLIEFNNAYKTYTAGDNKILALKNLTITVKSGEFLAIIGESGSGKSTLMNCLGCLDTIDSGDYFFDGTDISSQSDDELSIIRNQKIGFIFQGFNLIASLTALENVELPLIYRGMKHKLAKECALKALTQVNLSKRISHKPAQMSGGQQQRVAIARAIAAMPMLLLADEPTGNLDKTSANEIMKILLHLHENGKTIILITHDNSIAQMADRQIIMQS